MNPMFMILLVELLVLCVSPHVLSQPDQRSNIIKGPLQKLSNISKLNGTNTESDDDLKIVGGVTIDIKQAPYQVSFQSGIYHFCGGSIVSEDIIVTAAHCVAYSRPAALRIRVGSSSIIEGGQIVKVQAIKVHPDYKPLDYDIAVVWLAKPLQFSESIKPLPMINSGEEIPEGEMTMVTGWGTTKEGGLISIYLKMVEVPIVSEKNCIDFYNEKNITVTPTMLCAGYIEGGKDACTEDSGGPLVYNGKLAGVVSWGYGCARAKFPGVYAKVSALRKWVDDTITNIRLNQTVDLF